MANILLFSLTFAASTFKISILEDSTLNLTPTCNTTNEPHLVSFVELLLLLVSDHSEDEEVSSLVGRKILERLVVL